MFTTPLPRRLAAAALLATGLTVGCRSTNDRSCTNCGGGGATMAAAAPAVPSAPTQPQYARVRQPGNLSISGLPPVSNERYVNPQTVTAAKPNLEALEPTLPTPSLTPPVTIPAVVGVPNPQSEPPARRSYPDITARPEFAHSPDYSTLTGTLSYLAQKDQWRLRFASIDEEDKYGGSVTLDSGVEMKPYRNGQMVMVHGSMVDKDSRDIAPMYRVKQIAPLEK